MINTNYDVHPKIDKDTVLRFYLDLQNLCFSINSGLMPPFADMF